MTGKRCWPEFLFAGNEVVVALRKVQVSYSDLSLLQFRQLLFEPRESGRKFLHLHFSLSSC